MEMTDIESVLQRLKDLVTDDLSMEGSWTSEIANERCIEYAELLEEFFGYIEATDLDLEYTDTEHVTTSESEMAFDMDKNATLSCSCGYKGSSEDILLHLTLLTGL